MCLPVSSSGEKEPCESDESSHPCYPCPWLRADEGSAGGGTSARLCPSSLDGTPSRLSWPNDFCGADSHASSDFASVHCRSYSSYPRKRTPGTPKACSSGPFDFEGSHRGGGGGSIGGGATRAASPSPGSSSSRSPRQSHTGQFHTKSTSYTLEVCSDKPIEECNAKQSRSCPILPPRTPRPSDVKKDTDTAAVAMTTAVVAAAVAAVAAAAPDTTELADSASKSSSEQQDQQPSSLSASEAFSVSSPHADASESSWNPPTDLSGLSIEEVSRSLHFIEIGRAHV